jgi:hypothetical protein
MTGQIHSHFQAHTMETSMREDVFPGFVLARTTCDSHSTPNPTSRLSDPGMEGARCARGFLVGFGMEATSAILLYGLWEVLHFFR